MQTDIINFRTFWTAFRSYPWWQVAIEWLLIGLVVYWVVRFLRGTRGARLLKGIAFVLISLYLIIRLGAYRFGLERIDFLYRQFLGFASIAIIVVGHQALGIGNLLGVICAPHGPTSSPMPNAQRPPPTCATPISRATMLGTLEMRNRCLTFD